MMVPLNSPGNNSQDPRLRRAPSRRPAARLKSPVQILCIVLGSFTVEARDMILRAGPVESAPVIDGVLDDACWRESAMVGGYISIDGSWARPQTTGFVAYDDDFLYLAFHCDEPTADQMRIYSPEANPPRIFMGEDDHLGFMLDPEPNRPGYYHFAVNSVGSSYRSANGFGEDRAGSLEWEVKTAVGESHWIAECRVRMNSLGAEPPKPDTKWGVNLLRSRRAPYEEHSSWAGVTHFHQPHTFGLLAFDGPAELSCAMESIADRNSGYELRLRLRSATGKPLDIETAWSGSETDGKGSTTKLAPLEEAFVSISCQLPDSSRDIPIGLTAGMSAGLSVTRADTKERVVHKKALLLEEPRMGLSIDRYYYKPDDTHMRVSVTNRTSRKSTIVLEVDGSSLPARKFVSGFPVDSFEQTLPIGDWPEGRYRVSAHLMDSDAKRMQSIHRVVIKREIAPGGMPAGGGKVTVRPDGRLLLNGTPFFPFFSSTADRRIRENPDWWGPAADSFNVRYGTFALVENPMERPKVGLPWVTHEDGGCFILLPEEEHMLNGIRRVVSSRKNDPSILSWLIKYEAQYRLCRGEERTTLNNVEEFTKINRLVKSVDTNHLTSIHTNQPHLLPTYKALADIIEIALRSSSYAIRMIPNMVEDHRAVRQLIGPGKPYIFWLGSSIPHARYRTAEEMRCAAYLTVMSGAAGIIFHMGHDGVAKESTRHWSLYPGLSREVEALFQILCAPQNEPVPSIHVRPDAIHTQVYRHDGKVYLVAVNTADHRVEANVALPGPGIATLPFEDRSIELEGRSFTDEFTAYEPHMYELQL